MIESLRAGLDAFFAFIPQLIGAIVILIVLGVVAVAAAIAFGSGGRDVAKDIIERHHNRSHEATGEYR
jgi:hypothetical protein